MASEWGRDPHTPTASPCCTARTGVSHISYTIINTGPWVRAVFQGLTWDFSASKEEHPQVLVQYREALMSRRAHHVLKALETMLSRSPCQLPVLSRKQERSRRVYILPAIQKVSAQRSGSCVMFAIPMILWLSPLWIWTSNWCERLATDNVLHWFYI